MNWPQRGTLPNSLLIQKYEHESGSLFAGRTFILFSHTSAGIRRLQTRSARFAGHAAITRNIPTCKGARDCLNKLQKKKKMADCGAETMG